MAGDRLVPFRIRSMDLCGSGIAALAAPYLGMEDWLTSSSYRAGQGYPEEEVRRYREIPSITSSNPLEIMAAHNRFWKTEPWGLSVKDVAHGVWEINVAEDVPRPMVQKLRDDFKDLFGGLVEAAPRRKA